MIPSKDALLLVAHGTPDSPTDVPQFLRNVTGGRELPTHVVKQIAQRYAAIGRSPLTEITRQQAELVRARLKIPVYVGMRNWKPYISETISAMAAAGVTRAVAICMAPQNSRTSVGLYKRAILNEASGTIEIGFVESWHDHPLLVRAFADKLRPIWAAACKRSRSKVPVIFTTHSVPRSTIAAGDPYETQSRQTARLVAAQLPELAAELVSFAFQSQGMSGEEWLGPTVEETILKLKQAGHRAVVIQPIGFLCDHVEVLYDIDITFKKFAAEHGMELSRAESLNESALLADTLADLARLAFHRAGQPRSSPAAMKA